jgi:hypothetical protein
MTHYIQETDSKMVYALPSNFSFRRQLSDETFGGDLFPRYLPLIIGSRGVLTSAWGVTFRLDRTLGDEARNILSVIHNSLSTFNRVGIDLSYIPELQGFLADDGSFLLEWSFDNYRIGFSVELEVEQSSWFLITNKNLGEISASGFITRTDLKSLVLWLLNFILSHS